MAEKFYKGNGSTKDFAISFPYINQDDVKVSLHTASAVRDGVKDTDYTFLSATTIRTKYTAGTNNDYIDSDGDLTNGVKIRIYRDTSTTLNSTFIPGASIRSTDLNTNFNQSLYYSEESHGSEVNSTYPFYYKRLATGDLSTAADTSVTGAVVFNTTTKEINYYDGSAWVSNPAVSSSGNVTFAGTVTGNAFSGPLTGNVTGNITGNLTGNVTGNTSGTAATVTGAAQSAITSLGTLTGLTVDGNIHLDAANKEFAIKNGSGVNKFHVDSDNGNTTIQGTLGVTNLTALSGSLVVVGDTTIAGNTIIGDANSDTVTITAKLNSDLIPSATSIDLGASGTRFGDIFGTTVNSTSITGDAVVTSGTSSSDTKVYSAKRAEELFFNTTTGETIKDGDAFPDNDTTIATTAAINDRIIDLVDDVGGFVPLASEATFPATNPDVNNGAGTIVSVGVLSTSYTPSGGTVTIPDSTLSNISGSNVTITDCGSTVLAAGYGVLVETTTTLHTYKFHRLTPKATEVTTVAGNTTNINTVAGISSNVTTVAGISSNVTTVAGNTTNINTVAGSNSNITTVATNISSVNDFHDKYRIASSAPGSNNDDGDLYYNTADNKLYVYNGSAWEAAASLNGSGGTVTGDTTFTDTTKLKFGTSGDLEVYHDSNSYIKDVGDGYLQVSTNGSGVYFVKSDGSSLASFITDGSCELFESGNKKFETTGDGAEISNAANNKVDLKFHYGNNSGYSIIQMDNANNLILDCDPTSAGSNSFIQFKIDGSEVLKLDSNATFAGDITVGGTKPTITLNDTNSESDFWIQNDDGVFAIKDLDTGGGIGRLTIASNGQTTFSGNCDFSNGIDVTGDATVTNGLLQITSTTCLIDLMETSTTNHRIRNGSGNFYIQKISDDKNTTTDQLVIDGGTGATELYFDGNKKFETTSEGTKGYGNLRVSGAEGAGVSVIIQADEGDDYADFSRLRKETDGTFAIQNIENSSSWETNLQCSNDGNVALYYDNSKRLETTSTGVTITSPSHDGGLKVLAGNNNQESRLQLQGKASNGTEHNWLFGASRSADRFYISNGSSTHFALLDGGECLFGHTSSIDTSTFNSKIQVMGSTADTSSIAVGRFSDDGGAPSIHITKSRNGTVGNHGSGDLHDNDVVGNIFWWGSDSADYEEVAHIGCKASANFTQSSTPGDLTFWTTSAGATVATEKFRVRSSGRLDHYIYQDAIGLNQWSADDYYVKNIADTNRSGANASILAQHAVWNGKDVAAIKFRTGTDTTNKDDGVICFETSSANNIAERLRILSTGGITFNGDTAAANALDDYEEGTFTPTITGFTGGDTQTYTHQVGNYTKIGNMVYATFDVKLSDKGNISGNYTFIKGFPFSNLNSRGGSVVMHYWSGISNAASYMTAEFGGSISNGCWVIWTPAAGSTAVNYLNTSELDDATQFYGTAIYRTS
tara:strand:+ start:11600 stop:15925 length:4326 start_codon:yes stop_codon:yes gene_type:complete